MFRFLFLLVGIILAWFIVNIILRGIIATFGGPRSQRQAKPPLNRQTQQRFDDIKDAEFKDITDEKN
ncbi:MAG: hypothetical protein ABSB78_03245 [Bacteroidota bacterium]